MKPLTADLQDEETLRDLGSASVQIVHDLKNQINGLKLYATFLRKRMEKSQRPADELETVGKLLAGLERAATDMNALVRLGRPIELRRQPRADLARLLDAARPGQKVEADPGAYEGEFDTALLSEALKNIDEALRDAAFVSVDDASPSPLRLRRDEAHDGASAVIEWRGIQRGNEDDIFRSFAGSAGLRLALAARIIRAHGGRVAHERDAVRVRLPLKI